MFAIIDNEKYVLVEGTPIKYEKFLYVILEILSKKNGGNVYDFENVEIPGENLLYTKFKENGFVVPDYFIFRGNFVSAEKSFLWKKLPLNNDDREELFEIIRDIEYQYKNYCEDSI